ncbi:MAG: alpha/beta fold hydrolase, partial [Clostridia bacterium]|nr:alpha/beta fold hydrolase [Clostridia bacterium]
ADEKVMSLRCGPDGNPAYPVGVRSPIVNGILEHGRRYGANGIYRTVYLHLQEEFRPDYDVVLFEYDWREDPAESAKKLDAFVKKSGYRELILVAHSMGGLVASQFLALGEDQVRSVRKLIGFGIPFLGTEKAADVFFSGDALDVKYFGIDVADLLLAGCFRSVMTNFASVYALLPGKTNFRPFLRYTDGEGADRIPASYEETYGVFAAAVPGWNAGLFRSAQDNCEHLFTYNRHIAESVPTYLVVGTGIDTPSLLHIRIHASGAYSETVEYRTPDGDGYVGTRSSMPEGLPGNPDRLLVKNPPKDIYAGHIPMVEFASQDRGIALKFLDRAIKE